MRGAFGPCALAFWRWVIAAAILAPFVWPTLRPRLRIVRDHWRVLGALSSSFIVVFQVLMYVGLRYTTTINASVLYAAQPLLVVAIVAVVDGNRATTPQLAGMLASIAGVVIIMTHADLADLGAFTLHRGDVAILLAMPAAAAYTILLRRRPRGLDGFSLVFVLSLIGAVILAPAYAVEALVWIPPKTPTLGAIAGVAYVGIFASVVALLFWNQGVVAVGASAAASTVNLTPLFATVLAIALLGETPRGFHLAGGFAILAGVTLATYRRTGARSRVQAGS